MGDRTTQGDLSYWNEDGDGERSMALLVVAKLLTASKNTLSRLLVLVTAMGLSVVKPVTSHCLPPFPALGCLGAHDSVPTSRCPRLGACDRSVFSALLLLTSSVERLFPLLGQGDCSRMVAYVGKCTWCVLHACHSVALRIRIEGYWRGEPRLASMLASQTPKTNSLLYGVKLGERPPTGLDWAT
jgi:hypothetical protein